MNRILGIGAALLALAVAGCGSTGAGKYVNQAAAPPGQVKNAVLTGCNFVADIAPIAEIISSSPIIPTVTTMADAICNAVTTIPFADGPGDRKPRVNGVVVKGYFLKTK